MVEAVGVEPTSEDTSPQESTCVSPLESHRAVGEGREPVRGQRRLHSRAERSVAQRSAPSLLMTPDPAPQARTGRRSRSIKPRERAACPQLRCVPPDLRDDGARHASREPVPPSKPSTPPERCGSRTNPSILAFRQPRSNAAVRDWLEHDLVRQTVASVLDDALLPLPRSRHDPFTADGDDVQ
jgi:hypothetical protein